MSAAYIELLGSRGRSLSWKFSYPERDAYRAAMYRLRRRGLVAYVQDGQHQVLRLTSDGHANLRDYYAPGKAWGKRWPGYWYVLMYDVPEEHRANRHALRGFLERLRMGRLQKSVWITPHDIRPEFDDLQNAACISDYAVLMETRNVLGFTDRQLAGRAWDFDRLQSMQAAYCLTCREHLERLTTYRSPPAQLEQLARDEMLTYASVMESDPLLPRVLHPPGYRGLETYALHQRMVKAIARALTERG